MDDVIRVIRRGSFHVGGELTKIKGAPVEDLDYSGKFKFHFDPNGTHWTKQMYVQYTVLAEPKAPFPVLMWHGGGLTGVTWETTPDGREGWDTLFLRAGYDVYVSDAVERGRAGWAKFPEINPMPPVFHSFEARWLNLKMGETYPIPYEGQRFPVKYYDHLMMQGVPRWITSDAWTMNAYVEYLRKMQREVPGVVLMAHSQGCIFAQKAAQMFPNFVKALILVEPVVFLAAGEDLSMFKDIPMLFVWGDFMSEKFKIVHSGIESVRRDIPRYRAGLEKNDVDYTWMSLPEFGITGNSHMLMMDDNSAEIAGMICGWLESNGLGRKK